MKVKSFVKQNSPTFLLVFTSLLIFAIIFGLFQLEWQLYWIGAALILLIYFFYLVYRVLHFRKEQTFEQQVNKLAEQLKEERNASRLIRKDIEDYFLLWVHQVKTPITASYLLIEDSSSEQAPLLKQEVLKIENYTNMVLNYLKVLNPATDMDFSRVTMDEIIRPLLKQYRIQFIYSHVTLHYKKIDRMILTDPNLTSFMIEQILSNALKYMKNDKERDIWIVFNQDTYELSIRDNGIGIRSEDMQKIFDKGYAGMNGQLDTKSSGIGLYLVRLISKRLDQPVRVESTLGQGTLFTIQFSNPSSYKFVREML